MRQRLPGRRPRGDQPLREGPPAVARAGGQGQRSGGRSPHVRRLRRPHRRAPGAHGHQRPGGGQFGHRLPRSQHHHLPVHLVEEQLHPHRLRELGRHPERRRDRLPGPQEEGRDRRERQVHRLRRRRRHLRHRAPVPVGRHGARPQDALRLLRQRRLHEHRLPALRRHADRRLDHHQPSRRGVGRQAAGPQEPHRAHDRSRHQVRGSGLSPRSPRPGAQGGQGPVDRRPDLPQRARALPPRLARRRSRDHRPCARGGEHLLLAAVRVRGRRVSPHLSPAPQAAAGALAQAARPLRPPVPGEERADPRAAGALGGRGVGQAAPQVRRAERGRLAGASTGEWLPVAVSSAALIYRPDRGAQRMHDDRHDHGHAHGEGEGDGRSRRVTRPA